jgi:hypothetical protein
MRSATWLGVTAVALAACSSGDTGKRSHDSASAAGIMVSPAEFTSAAKYVGIRYDSLPPRFKLESGALLPKSPGASAAAFDLDRVRTPRGEMIWLDSLVAVPGRARPGRIVRAELKVPPLAADERVIVSSCDVDGRLDPHVVAVVVVEANQSKFTSIRQAWRANAATGQFDVIPVTGIVCDETGS